MSAHGDDFFSRRKCAAHENSIAIRVDDLDIARLGSSVFGVFGVGGDRETGP
jgi:hypothetical protein